MQSSGASTEVVRHPGLILVRIAGVIDEHFDRTLVMQVLQNPSLPILVDVDGVARITSYGVREWLRGFQGAVHADIYFVGCRPSLLAQFNSIAQFGSLGHIVTLYCPYVCVECGKPFEVLTDVRKTGEQLRAFQAPEAACPFCAHKPAAFDDLEASYFSCLAERPLRSVPRAIDLMLDGDKRAPVRALKVFKDVSGDVTALWLVGSLDASARLKRQADGLEGDAVVVLAGLRSADSQGLARLGEVLAQEGPRLFLARVPVEIALLLAGDAAALGRAVVLSVFAETTCPTCGGPSIPELGAPIRHGGPPRCPVCGTDLRAVEVDARLAGLPWADAPAAVAAYLQSHPTQPGGRAAQDDSTVPSQVPAQQVGKYEIVKRIGIGGMAEVFLGRHVGMEGFEKKVVIKRILPHLAAQPSFVEQFLQEARVVARLAHPHIVQIFDLGRDGEHYFIVMELVNGHDFNALIRMASKLDEHIPIGVVARITAALCAGLHAAHTYCDDQGLVKPVLHRDVSPHNVLVGVDGSVKITDFGVAKASGSLDQTGAGTLKGKVLYMAPEHVLGRAADHRIDIFAAGLCLYYGLVQHHPFSRMNEVSALKAVLTAQIPLPTKLRGEIPPELERIVMRALERDPERRYPSAEEMGNDLERFLLEQQHATFKDVGEWVRDVADRMKTVPAPLNDHPSNATPNSEDATLTTPEGSLERADRLPFRAVVNGDDD